MSAIYDNWERLLASVLKREQYLQLCHTDSLPSAGSISSSYNLSSRTSDLAAGSWVLRPASPHQLSQPPSTSFLMLQKNRLALKSTSAEVHFEALRKEKFAVPYRSVMDNGITTVVKRLRALGGSERDILARNVEVSSSIRRDTGGYFSYDDEMLIIYEYRSQDSVSNPNTMHGKKSGVHLLDWESRLRIAICIARAIATTHGEITATGTLLNSQDDSDDCFSDLVLENMAESSIVVPTSGHRAPEVNCARDLSEESDIYSFGVFLLELLTGKFPMKGHHVVDRVHLVRWATRKFLEAGTLIAFEFVPVGNPTELIQMWKMLLVAIRCVEDDPKQRPELSQVARMMEDIIKTVHPKNGNCKES